MEQDPKPDRQKKMVPGLWGCGSLCLQPPAALEAEGAARAKQGSNFAVPVISDGEARTREGIGTRAVSRVTMTVMVAQWLTQAPGLPTQVHRSWV